MPSFEYGRKPRGSAQNPAKVNASLLARAVPEEHPFEILKSAAPLRSNVMCFVLGLVVCFVSRFWFGSEGTFNHRFRRIHTLFGYGLSPVFIGEKSSLLKDENRHAM